MNTKPQILTDRVMVRLKREHVDTLAAIAEREHGTVSDAMRWLIEQHDRRAALLGKVDHLRSVQANKP